MLIFCQLFQGYKTFGMSKLNIPFAINFLSGDFIFFFFFLYSVHWGLLIERVGFIDMVEWGEGC